MTLGGSPGFGGVGGIGALGMDDDETGAAGGFGATGIGGGAVISLTLRGPMLCATGYRGGVF